MNAETIGNIEHMLTGWELFSEKVKGLKLYRNVDDVITMAVLDITCAITRKAIRGDDDFHATECLNDAARNYHILKERLDEYNRSPAAAADPAEAGGSSCTGE